MNEQVEQTGVVHLDEARPIQPAARQQRTTLAPVKAADDQGWVVRPKRTQPQKGMYRPGTRRPSHRRPPGAALDMSSLPPAADQRRRGGWSKPLIAFCLAGTVYLAGLAGVWSMYQAFDAPASPSLSPAAAPKFDRHSLPPVEETIDVRDAWLDDDVFRPEFKPDAVARTG